MLLAVLAFTLRNTATGLRASGIGNCDRLLALIGAGELSVVCTAQPAAAPTWSSWSSWANGDETATADSGGGGGGSVGDDSSESGSAPPAVESRNAPTDDAASGTDAAAHSNTDVKSTKEYKELWDENLQLKEQLASANDVSAIDPRREHHSVRHHHHHHHHHHHSHGDSGGHQLHRGQTEIAE